MKSIAPCTVLVLMLATSSHLPAWEQPAALPETSIGPATTLTTLALRVHRLEPMRNFYGEAFGIEFRQVQTGAVQSWFGEVGGVTIKLVPIRESSDFEGYPLHQPGFVVPDVERIIEVALRWGGRQEGHISELEGRVHGAVRDPDGNTVELYSRGSNASNRKEASTKPLANPFGVRGRLACCRTRNNLVAAVRRSGAWESGTRTSDGFRPDTKAAAQFPRESSSFRQRSRCSTKSLRLPTQ